MSKNAEASKTKGSRDDVESQEAPWLYDQMHLATEDLSRRLVADLEKWPLIHFLTRHFGSLLFGAGQKLIDMAGKTGQARAADQAVALTCARLTSECYAAYGLLQRGLIIQSIVMLRSAFEISTQGLVFLTNDKIAEQWLKGKKIRPREVRALTSMPQQMRDLYTKLANLAHPNFTTVPYSLIPVRRTGALGSGSIYGGWYAPKHAGQIAIQLLWSQLVFLERFYETYNAELSEHGFLWREETQQTAFGKKTPPDDFTWEKYLGVWRQALTKLAEDHERSLPDDMLEVSVQMSDYSEEEAGEFRRGYRDAKAEMNAQSKAREE